MGEFKKSDIYYVGLISVICAKKNVFLCWTSLRIYFYEIQEIMKPTCQINDFCSINMTDISRYICLVFNLIINRLGKGAVYLTFAHSNVKKA